MRNEGFAGVRFGKRSADLDCHHRLYGRARGFVPAFRVAWRGRSFMLPATTEKI
jgi:hypothetical protein